MCGRIRLHSRRTSPAPRSGCDGAPQDVDTDLSSTLFAVPAHSLDRVARDRTRRNGIRITVRPNGALETGYARMRCKARVRSFRPAGRAVRSERMPRADLEYGAVPPTSKPHRKRPPVDPDVADRFL